MLAFRLTRKKKLENSVNQCTASFKSKYTDSYRLSSSYLRFIVKPTHTVFYLEVCNRHKIAKCILYLYIIIILSLLIVVMFLNIVQHSVPPNQYKSSHSYLSIVNMFDFNKPFEATAMPTCNYNVVYYFIQLLYNRFV